MIGDAYILLGAPFDVLFTPLLNQGGFMRKFIGTLAMVLTITSFSPVDSAAKPAYCRTALMRCYDECAEHYSSDFNRTFCYAGCLIGYANCGS